MRTLIDIIIISLAVLSFTFSQATLEREFDLENRVDRLEARLQASEFQWNVTDSEVKAMNRGNNDD